MPHTHAYTYLHIVLIVDRLAHNVRNTVGAHALRGDTHIGRPLHPRPAALGAERRGWRSALRNAQKQANMRKNRQRKQRVKQKYASDTASSHRRELKYVKRQRERMDTKKRLRSTRIPKKRVQPDMSTRTHTRTRRRTHQRGHRGRGQDGGLRPRAPAVARHIHALHAATAAAPRVPARNQNRQQKLEKSDQGFRERERKGHHTRRMKIRMISERHYVCTHMSDTSSRKRKGKRLALSRENSNLNSPTFHTSLCLCPRDPSHINHAAALR